MARALEIEEHLDEGMHVLRLVGQLDTNASSQLDVVASRIFAADRTADIVVDMEKCSYVSSAGLRVIVTMQKRTSAGGSLRFCHVSADVMDVFVSMGFDSILAFE